MKTFVKITVALVAIIMLVSQPTVWAAENQVDVRLYPVMGPVKADATFGQWARNVVWQLYTNQTLEPDLGHRLKPEYVTQTGTSPVIWWVAHVTKRGTNTVALTSLHGSQSSSDSGNALGISSQVPSNGIYSDRAMGVVWGPSGPRTSDSLIHLSQSASNRVDEIIVPILESSSFPYSLAVVSNALSAFTGGNGFVLSAQCLVTDPATGLVVGKGSRALQTLGVPIRPEFTIRANGQHMTIGVNMETNRTALVESKPRFSPGEIWTFEGTINANEEIVRHGTEAEKYFRARPIGFPQ